MRLSSSPSVRFGEAKYDTFYLRPWNVSTPVIVPRPFAVCQCRNFCLSIRGDRIPERTWTRPLSWQSLIPSDHSYRAVFESSNNSHARIYADACSGCLRCSVTRYTVLRLHFLHLYVSLSFSLLLFFLFSSQYEDPRTDPLTLKKRRTNGKLSMLNNDNNDNESWY